ncbi:NAD(P)/FAD-dependent oxidoreductase [uncultured Dysosmobacter sp.]|uniref:NAD(P)/FAD-dependent oxidoreductase n=1 Tax=uncultured Dysosmobacter sp. TaxID=2591384 RepID=UPI002633EB23|nr:FAD-dependent oxidoreductase [uncultured Dysosmobacter sp.]
MKNAAIIGFGCAGYHAAKALREKCPACDIHVYSNTHEAPANPMLTTYYVAGKLPRSGVFPLGTKEEIVSSLNIRLHEDTPVKRVLAEKRAVVLEDGTETVYDEIILASGSHPFMPPIKGLPKRNVYVMRTVDDADLLLNAIHGGISSALVIGASWVGIKVVEALAAHQVPTTMADMAPRIFPTAILPDVADVIHARLEAKGISLLFGRGIDSMEEQEDGIVCRFSDGTSIKTQIVALCLGLRPSISYLDPAEIKINRGVVVDMKMRTSVPHIYAVGDCCEAKEIIHDQYVVVNLWANAVRQGTVAGSNAAGGDESFQGNFTHNITHFLGMDFIGIGDNRAQGDILAYESPSGDVMFRAIIENGKIACINILDNYKISGVLKNYMIKRVLGSDEPFDDKSRVRIMEDPLGRALVDLLETSAASDI